MDGYRKLTARICPDMIDGSFCLTGGEDHVMFFYDPNQAKIQLVKKMFNLLSSQEGCCLSSFRKKWYNISCVIWSDQETSIELVESIELGELIESGKSIELDEVSTFLDETRDCNPLILLAVDEYIRANPFTISNILSIQEAVLSLNEQTKAHKVSIDKSASSYLTCLIRICCLIHDVKITDEEFASLLE
jgi:hypothetical protein